jgi:hypothetical protein
MSDFEKKDGNFTYAVVIGGIVFFVVTGLVWFGVWHFGMGGWKWADVNSEKRTLSANFLYFVHLLFPNYIGSLGRTWSEYSIVLVRRGIIDSFLIQIYFPPTIGLILGALTTHLVYKSDTKKPTATTGYVRGNKIK